MNALELAKRLLEVPDADVVVLLNRADETNPASYSEAVDGCDCSKENNIAILTLKEKP